MAIIYFQNVNSYLKYINQLFKSMILYFFLLLNSYACLALVYMNTSANNI